jgi:hypothetical protein
MYVIALCMITVVLKPCPTEFQNTIEIVLPIVDILEDECDCMLQQSVGNLEAGSAWPSNVSGHCSSECGEGLTASQTHFMTPF